MNITVVLLNTDTLIPRGRERHLHTLGAKVGVTGNLYLVTAWLVGLAAPLPDRENSPLRAVLIRI